MVEELAVGTEGDEYNKFDKINILSNIIVQHKEATVARNMQKLLRKCLNVIIQKILL